MINIEEADEAVDLVERVCALDIGKAALTVCIRVPHDDKPGHRRQEVREHATTTRSLLYSRTKPGALALPAGREALLRGFTAIIVGIGMFWAATNYATVEGTEFAESFLADVTKLPSVAVYSPERLHINAPGAKEQRLPPKQSMYKYRYVGLRLLEHTGGRYFLISKGWSPRYGVVVMLARRTWPETDLLGGERGFVQQPA